MSGTLHPGTRPDGGMVGYLALAPQPGGAPSVYSFTFADKLSVSVAAGTGGAPATITVNDSPQSSPAGKAGLLVGIVDPGSGAGTVRFYATGSTDTSHPSEAALAQQNLTRDLDAAEKGQILLIASTGTWLSADRVTAGRRVRFLRAGANFSDVMKVIEGAGGSSNAFGFSALPALSLSSTGMAASAGVNLGGPASKPYALVGVIGEDTGIESTPVIPPGSSVGSIAAELRRQHNGRFADPVGAPNVLSPDTPSLLDIAYQTPIPWTLDSAEAQAALESMAKQILDTSNIPYTGSAADALRVAYLNQTLMAGLVANSLPACPTTPTLPADVAACQLNSEISALRSLDGYVDNLRSAMTAAELAEAGQTASVADDIVVALQPPPSSNSTLKFLKIFTDVTAVASVVATAGGQPEAAGALRGMSALGTVAQSLVQPNSDGSPRDVVTTRADRLTNSINDGLAQQTLMLDVVRGAIASDRGRLAAFSAGRGTTFAWTPRISDDTTFALRASIRKQVYTGLLPQSIPAVSFPDSPDLPREWPGVRCLEAWAQNNGVPTAYRWYRLAGIWSPPIIELQPEPLWDARALSTPQTSPVVTAQVFQPRRDGGLGLYPPKFYADAYGTGSAPAADVYGHSYTLTMRDGTQAGPYWEESPPYESCWGL